jgi:hypothetical protein
MPLPLPLPPRVVVAADAVVAAAVIDVVVVLTLLLPWPLPPWPPVAGPAAESLLLASAESLLLASAESPGLVVAADINGGRAAEGIYVMHGLSDIDFMKSTLESIMNIDVYIDNGILGIHSYLLSIVYEKNKNPLLLLISVVVYTSFDRSSTVSIVSTVIGTIR